MCMYVCVAVVYVYICYIHIHLYQALVLHSSFFPENVGVN